MLEQGIKKFRDFDSRPMVFDFPKRKVFFYSGEFQKKPKYVVAFDDIELFIRRTIAPNDLGWGWALVLKAKPLFERFIKEQKDLKKQSKWQRFFNFFKFKPLDMCIGGMYWFKFSYSKQKVCDEAKKLAQKCECQLTIFSEDNKIGELKIKY